MYKPMPKRKLDVLVISDVHLGTFGCKANALNQYLKSVDPKILILNGDIIDVWQFRKRYWPNSHMKVVQRIFKMLSNGTEVHYLTGNHDEMLRRFCDFRLGGFHLANKLVLNLDGKKMWFFHGDVFDITMKHSKWLAKLGAVGYDILILLNNIVNWICQVTGRERVSFSKRIKNSVKQAIQFIDDFEKTAIEIAAEKGYDYVACGHIHQPTIKTVDTSNGSVIYLNSGDWIENLTALEYNNNKWTLYQHQDDFEMDENTQDDIMEIAPDMETLLNTITGINTK
jgi:UDP-2,3-diacylglucosamine pyrophosphatase LpxH